MPRVPHSGLDEAKLPARVGFGSKTNPGGEHGVVVVESVRPRGVAKGEGVLALSGQRGGVAPGSGNLDPISAGHGVVCVPGAEISEFEFNARRLGAGDGRYGP